MPITTSIIIFF